MNTNSKIPENKEPESKRQFGWTFWIYLLLFLILLLQVPQFVNRRPIETTWNEFEKMIEENDVEEIVVVNKEQVEIKLFQEKLAREGYADVKDYNSGPHYYFTIGSVESFESRLLNIQNKYQLENIPELRYVNRTNWAQSIFSWLIPLILIFGIWVFILGRLGRSGGMGGFNPFEFGKSKPTLMTAENRSKVTFDEVAGLDEAKVEIQEIVTFLKNPEQYTRLGAKIPKGVILVGPPGTGKTLLAKAVAGEAQVPFFHISGSEFVEMFVGVGASRVRDLFRKAKEQAPSIIFIDEIDAIGRARGSAFSMRSNDERESTLNQLLTEMDGFGTNTGVIVLAATNRADILDSALLRPGRFDRHIYLELPGLTERKAIFKVHLKPLKLADNIRIDVLAAHTPGFSGADIANICNEAALIAARNGKTEIEMRDFMDATDRIIAGMEKKTKIISPEEKEIIAYHEAGHATVSWYLKHADSLMKVSIVPRGKSLGSAWYLPEVHQIYTKPQFIDRICVALGGRAAEELIFGQISSGALDDLEKVTKLAYTMVAYYGLDSKLGHISYYDSTGQYEQSLQKPYSEATAQLIDEEVRKLVDSSYQRTKKVLTEHKNQLAELAKRLLHKEIVVQDELEEIFGKRGELYKKKDVEVQIMT